MIGRLVSPFGQDLDQAMRRQTLGRREYRQATDTEIGANSAQSYFAMVAGKPAFDADSNFFTTLQMPELPSAITGRFSQVDAAMRRQV